MKSAGGILLAKTNLPEFSSATETDNLVTGRTNNPWNLDRTRWIVRRRLRGNRGWYVATRYRQRCCNLCQRAGRVHGNRRTEGNPRSHPVYGPLRTDDVGLVARRPDGAHRW